MFPCSFCRKAFVSVDSVIFHMRHFHSLPPSGYLCKIGNCGRKYDRLANFKSHMGTAHPNGGERFPEPDDVIVNDFHNDFNDEAEVQAEVENVNLNDALNEMNPQASVDSMVRCVSESALTFVSQLYSSPTLNRSDVDCIVNQTNQFVNSITGHLKMGAHGEQVLLHELFAIAENPFLGLETESQRFEALKSSRYYIPPKSFNIDYAQDVADQVPFCGQFVPPSVVLKQFFEMPGVFSTVLSYYNSLVADQTGVKKNVVQCTLWQENILPRYFGKTVFPIVTYFDEFDPDNINGSHQGDHKLGGNYFTCPVIPPQFSSKLQNIFVASLFIAHDRNVHDGNRKVFHLLIEDLKMLEEHGLLLKVGGEDIRIYFALVNILGDNLGLNSILGFTECFTANYPCRICKMHYNDIQRMLFIPPELVRTPQNYDQDVAINDMSLTGVHERCAFDELQSFKTVLNHSVCVMHDALEGVFKYDMCKILYNLIYIAGYFDLETLKLRINDFKYGPGESGNKIPEQKITRERLVNDSLNLSSSEMLCLVRYLAPMIGDLVPENDPVWSFYLILLEILDIIFAPSFKPGTPDELEMLLRTHHSLYLELFHLPLKPKFHFLLHYPAIMKSVGPVVHLSSMRWEGKHRELKQYVIATNSRINLPKTVLIKCMLRLGFYFLSRSVLVPDFHLGVLVPTIRNFVDPFNLLTNVNPGAINLDVVSQVTINGNLFKKGMLVHTGYGPNPEGVEFPLFLEIDTIIYNGVTPSRSPIVYFLCHKVHVLFFNEHLRSYEITIRNEEWASVHFEGILSYYPMECRDLPNGKTYVTPRFLL